MELIEIAQLVTGIATLIVALVLVYQLRQQHRDTEIQISMDSVSNLINMSGPKDYSPEFTKMLVNAKNSNFSDLNQEEKLLFENWAGLFFTRVQSEWRLGRMSGDKVYFATNFRTIFKYPASYELYHNRFRKMLIWIDSDYKKGILKIADEVYEEITGEKIGD